jgi:hypothetical protein
MVLEKVRPWAVFMNVRAGHGRGKAMAWPRLWCSATRESDGGLRVRNAARQAPAQDRGTGDPRASYWRVHRRQCRSRRTARQGGGQRDSGLPVRAEDGEGGAVTRRGCGEVDAVQAAHDHRCRRTGRRLSEAPWAVATWASSSAGLASRPPPPLGRRHRVPAAVVPYGPLLLLPPSSSYFFSPSPSPPFSVLVAGGGGQGKELEGV